MRPGRLDLAGGRWVPFVSTLVIKGKDLTGAACSLQVRLTPDALGSPLVDLVAVGTSSAEGVYISYGGTDSINAHVTAGRLSAIPDGSLGTDTLTMSIVGIRINETTMEGMPFPGERGEDSLFAWDLHITPPGGLKQKWLGGKFAVEAGATQ